VTVKPKDRRVPPRQTVHARKRRPMKRPEVKVESAGKITAEAIDAMADLLIAIATGTK